MNYYKKAVLFSFLIILVLLFAGTAVADQTKNPLAIDLVIAIDDRYENYLGPRLDQFGLRFEAASALISMCDAQYSRATYYMFNDNLFIYSGTKGGKSTRVQPEEIALFEISLPSHKPQRLNMMQSLSGDILTKYDDGINSSHHSDVGLALSAAVNVEINNLNNGNRKIIMLISSGDNSLPETSLEKARAAKKLAVENDIEIYSVVYKNGAAAKILQELVTKSSNYQFAANVEDLVDVFRNFFADMIGSTPKEIKSTKQDDGNSKIQLTIPNDSVAEVNLIIPVKEVSDLELIAPDGTEIKKSDNSVLVNQSRNFSTYKLIDPKPADYVLHYKSNDEKEIVVQYVFSYSVQVEAETNAKQLSKHEPVTIKARYTQDGIPTTDEKLYTIPATLSIFKNNKQIATKKMETDNNGYTLTFEDLIHYGAGDYQVKIHFEGDGLVRDCETAFSLINDAPILIDAARNGEEYEVKINMPTDPESYDIKKNSKTWNLNDFVKDINGDNLIGEIVTSPDNMDVVCDEMTLTVTPRKNTAAEGDIKILVKDTDGAQSKELVFPVKFINYEDRYDSYTARFDQIKEFEKSSSHEIRLRVYDANGNVIRNDDQLPETVAATIKSGNGPQDITLTADKDGWVGTFETGKMTDDYTIDATIKVGQKNIAAQQYTLRSNNAAPILQSGQNNNMNWNVTINDPQIESSYEIQEKSWELDQILTDPDGDALTYRIQSAPEGVRATITDGNKLVVKTKLNTAAQGTIVVSSEDTEGLRGPDLSFDIKVSVDDQKYSDYSAELSTDNKKKSNEIKVILCVYKTGTEGGRILDTDDINLPKEITATVTQGHDEFPIQLIRGEDGKWTGSFDSINKVTDYTIATQIEVSRDQKIVPENLIITTENAAPKVKKELVAVIPTIFNIDPFLFWKDETKPVEIDLNEFFDDTDKDQLTYSIDDKAAAMLKGNSLTVNGFGVKDGATFTITATDNDGDSVTSKPITYKIHSLKNQGIITIGIVVAAIILLLIFIHAIKPKYPNARFEVSVDSVPYGEGQELPKGKMAKKKAKLSTYAPTLAVKEYGPALHQILGYIILKPSYGQSIKVDASQANGANIKINNQDVRKGKLANNGKISITKDNKTVLFTLKILTSGAKTMTKTTTSTTKPTQTPRRTTTSRS